MREEDTSIGRLEIGLFRYPLSVCVSVSLLFDRSVCLSGPECVSCALEKDHGVSVCDRVEIDNPQQHTLLSNTLVLLLDVVAISHTHRR